MLNHIHLIINAKTSLQEIKKEEAERFIEELLSEIGMERLGALKFAEAQDLAEPGQSFVQMLTTSHCSLHFFEKERTLYFDLYSCKDFEEGKVVGMLQKHFAISDWYGLKYNRIKNHIKFLRSEAGK